MGPVEGVAACGCAVCAAASPSGRRCLEPPRSGELREGAEHVVHARFEEACGRSSKPGELQRQPASIVSTSTTTCDSLMWKSQNMSKHTITKRPSSKSKRERAACCCSSLESALLAWGAGCDATW